MVRLGVPEDTPLGVQQWQALIAINYPARKFGLNRHVTPVEAKQLCPEIVLQHVATWKEGDEQWQYHEDAAKHIATHKVSLDPYRRESKKILATIKAALPAPPLQRVEKAGIDEVFIDLSAHVHSILLERYPELDGPPPYDDPTEHLPRPPITALDWNTDYLVDLDEGHAENDDPDWDDVVFSIASDIVRGVRKIVREKLKYTTSSGISRNKMLAKLGSAYKKPNQQTVIRNRAVQQFLGGFKFTKIRNLGGKLGDDVVAMFNTDTVEELLKVPLEAMRKLGDDTGSWLYNTIRGEDNSEVNPRTQIKSMLSAKSFRPSVNNFEQGARWLRIFAADIFSRCVEEGVLENKRRPKTINLHHRQGAQTRSRQAPIPQGKPLTEQILFELAKNLLAQVVVDGRAWPCAHLSLSVGGFEDGVTGNRSIGGFLVRGDEAKALFNKESVEERDRQNSEQPSAKKRRVESTTTLNRFFVPKEDIRDSGTEHYETDDIDEHGDIAAQDHNTIRHKTPEDQRLTSDQLPPSAQGASMQHFEQRTLNSYFCPHCNTHVSEKQAEHDDWHFAKDLADEMRAQDQTTSVASRPVQHVAKPPPTRGRGRPPGGSASSKKAERGQRTLAFEKG
jgi:DNA polymerase eta